MTTLTAALAILAVYRLTLLVTADKITAVPRGWLHNRLMDGEHYSLAFLLGCPWCASAWLALPVVWSAIEWGNGWGWQLTAGTLAASGVAGFMATFAAPEEE